MENKEQANSPMDGERGGGEGEGKKDESFRVTCFYHYGSLNFTC